MSQSDTSLRDDGTTIRVFRDTWKELNARKNVGEDFDDVINRLIEKAENSDKEVSTE